MKYIIILGDGMSDRPIAALNGKTPLMVADIPTIHDLCRNGVCGSLITVPCDMMPGSEIANLSVLGYDIKTVYQGRGVLEAASLGVPLDTNDLALRCNLICIEDEKIKNHSSGHISTQESHILIDDLNKKFGDANQHFYPGVSYRHVCVIKNGSADIVCTPPHDVPLTPFRTVLIQASNEKGQKTAHELNELIFKSQDFLKEHPINRARQNAGKDPANSLWFWSPGYKPSMKPFQELYNKSGAVISAVDLLHGIGIYAGMSIITVEGATGLITTNYEGKAHAAIQALRTHDFVYVHVEATDEAGHEGDYGLKIRALEALDKRLINTIVRESEFFPDQLCIAVLPDHATPCEIRTHVHDPVPFLIYNPTLLPDSVTRYDEESVKDGRFGMLQGDQFIKVFFSNNVHS